MSSLVHGVIAITTLTIGLVSINIATSVNFPPPEWLNLLTKGAFVATGILFFIESGIHFVLSVVRQ